MQIIYFQSTVSNTLLCSGEIQNVWILWDNLSKVVEQEQQTDVILYSRWFIYKKIKKCDKNIYSAE